MRGRQCTQAVEGPLRPSSLPDQFLARPAKIGNPGDFRPQHIPREFSPLVSSDPHEVWGSVGKTRLQPPVEGTEGLSLDLLLNVMLESQRRTSRLWVL